jgi:pimeloyl-ACP methyl ester carboxylesterase
MTDGVSSSSGDADGAEEHSVAIPGGAIYYRTQGSGPPLVLIGGGPSNADTLTALAHELVGDRTVVTYDRRGYSRSPLEKPFEPVDMRVHADDVNAVIGDLSAGPATVFATSVGALIGLELAASHPDAVARVIVHEPPLGDLVPAEDRASFDVELDDEDAGTALDQIAASIGVTRGRSLTSDGDRPEVRSPDVEVFIRRDVPAIGSYELDLDRLAPLTDRLLVTASEEGRDYYPYRCAAALADAVGTQLIELPGDHAAMIARATEFAARLRPLLP